MGPRAAACLGLFDQKSPAAFASRGCWPYRKIQKHACPLRGRGRALPLRPRPVCQPPLLLPKLSQEEGGDWPQQHISGVFNRNCMITYANYR